jgi:hypothetical protein
MRRWNVAKYDPLDEESDPFRPPKTSTVVSCLHCGEEYDSYRIEWRILQDAQGRPHGFWCCPIEGCDGKGFGIDIFPVDPNYVHENGELIFMVDDEEQDFEDEAELPRDGDLQSDDAPPGDHDDVPW